MKTSILLSLPVLLAASRLAAAPFEFASTNFPPDLMVGLRKTGGASELVANLGSVARFYNAAAGAVIPVTEFTATQFTDAFTTSDGVGFAAFAAVRVDGDADHPFQSIWATRKRSDINEQSTPWRRQGAGTLGTTASRIASVGSGAATYSGSIKPSDDNGVTAVVIPASSTSGYTTSFGSGNFKGTFQGNAENTAPSDFSSGSDPIRSDLYEIVPGTGDAKYLGYFEFAPTGTLSFHAPGGVVQPPAAPRITSIVRDGTSTKVTITSEAGANYQLLRAPNGDFSSPFAGWTPVGAPVAAAGATLEITADTGAADGFFAVGASR